MGNKFGKARVPGCECTYRFTCRACLLAAGPTIVMEPASEVELMCDKCGYGGWNSSRVGDLCPRRRDHGLCGGRLQAVR